MSCGQYELLVVMLRAMKLLVVRIVVCFIDWLRLLNLAEGDPSSLLKPTACKAK